MVQFSNQFNFLRLVYFVDWFYFFETGFYFLTLLFLHFLEFSYYMNIFSKLISGINIFQRVVIIILVHIR